MTKEQKLEHIYGIFMGDVDPFIEKGPEYIKEWVPVIDLWIYKDDILKNQNEKCIDYVYNLYINYKNRCATTKKKK